MYAGKKLRQLRLNLDKSQEEMADSIGLSRSYYSAVEIGKRKITKKMIEKIKNKWGVDEGYFVSEKIYNDTNKKGGTNEGINEGAIYTLADAKGLKGENKAIFATYELLEKLYSNKLKTKELTDLILIETSKWENKTLNYYLKSDIEIKQDYNELFKVKYLVSEVICNIDNLKKIADTYFYSVLNSNIEYNDYQSFKEERIKNLKKLLPYCELLESLNNELNSFLKPFSEKFDEHNIID